MANLWTKAARCGHLLSVVLCISATCRMVLSVNPTYDVALPVVGKVGSIFVVSVWLLMPAMFVISIAYVFAIVKEFSEVLKVLVAMIKDPSSIPHLTAIVFLKAYELWLINFIYQKWTIDFLLLVQIVQLLPAITLFLHSFFQLCMIAVSSNFERRSRKIGLFAKLQISINITMLIHLLCTVIVVCCQDPWKFQDIAVLVVSELVFRILGLVAFSRLVCGQAVMVSDSQDIPSLEFARPSLLNRQHGITDHKLLYQTVCYQEYGIDKCELLPHKPNVLVLGNECMNNVNERKASLSTDRTGFIPESSGDIL